MGNTRPDEFHDRPEIDRIRLRDILLDSLQPSTIQWNRKLLRVEADPRNREKYNLHFADNSVETGVDLVVGADGAWSKVRALHTDEKPFYSGITAIELWALDVDSCNPWLSKYVGNGSLFMFDEGRALLCQRNGNGSIRGKFRQEFCLTLANTFRPFQAAQFLTPYSLRLFAPARDMG